MFLALRVIARSLVPFLSNFKSPIGCFASKVAPECSLMLQFFSLIFRQSPARLIFFSFSVRSPAHVSLFFSHVFPIQNWLHLQRLMTTWLHFA